MKYRISLVTSLMAASISSCSNDQLPAGATLTLTPGERSIQIEEVHDGEDRCVYYPDFHVDLPLHLSLQDASGIPIGNAEIRVYVDFAENTFSGYPVLELYRDFNGNGVVDAPGELVSGSGDAVASIDTSRYGGEAVLLLRANLSCRYRGEIFAYAGATHASAHIETVASSLASPESTAIREP